MRKGREILGKTIVAYDTGTKFDRVADLIFDQETNQVVGFLLDEATWFRSARVLPLQNVKAIGPDAVIVSSEKSVSHASAIPVINKILKRNNVLKGTRILTVNGQDLGTMVDLYFDEQSGLVEGYEVSGGLFADAYSGRSFVPAPTTLHIGEDVAFVPAYTAALMEEQVGGIKGAAIAASDKVQETAQSTGGKLQEIGKATGEKVQSAAEVTGEKFQELREVATVKAQDAAAATSGKLQELQITASEKAQIAAQKAQAAAAAGSQKAQAMARNTSTSLTNSVISPEEQRAFVVGKVAQQTVTAPDGTTVVFEGERITYDRVAIAQGLGVLDVLYRAAGGRLSEQISEKLSDRLNSAVASLGVEEAIGKRVQGFVRTDTGIIIAASGQIVTESVVARAKTYHQEQALLHAVGLSADTVVKGQAQQFFGTTGDRLKLTTQSTGEQLQSSAQTVWAQVKTTATELKELSTHAITEKRVKSALGRPVTRVILDQNDAVILNVGELITHQAIDAARESDVLDLLLGSVYTETPKLSLQDLRAPEAGKAAL